MKVGPCVFPPLCVYFISYIQLVYGSPTNTNPEIDLTMYYETVENQKNKKFGFRMFDIQIITV